ncbi:MAG: hypothetical protein Q9218_003506 [Villophora microphyllina]
MSEAQLNYLRHSHVRVACEHVWMNTGKVLAELQSLEVLTLDVDQAYCTEGCCRQIATIIKCFEGINMLRKTHKGPPVKVEILGALNLDEDDMLMRGFAGELTQEDDSHGSSGTDDLDNDLNDDDAKNTSNDPDNGEVDSEDDQSGDDYNESSTNSDLYRDEDSQALNPDLYLEYMRDNEEVTASRKRYVCARFDNYAEESPDPSLFSDISRVHYPSQRRMVTIRYIYLPQLIHRPWNIHWQQKKGLSLLRTSERKFVKADDLYVSPVLPRQPSHPSIVRGPQVSIRGTLLPIQTPKPNSRRYLRGARRRLPVKSSRDSSTRVYG